MFIKKTRSVEDRIVVIHQPHVRPIARVKSNATVEFGAKINVSLVDGFSFLDDHSWDAYNEGTRLKDCIEKYKSRFGYYPLEVLVDKNYCTRINRAYLKEFRSNTKSKTSWKTIETGIVKSSKSGRTQPHRRQIWTSENSLRAR